MLEVARFPQMIEVFVRLLGKAADICAYVPFLDGWSRERQVWSEWSANCKSSLEIARQQLTSYAGWIEREDPGIVQSSPQKASEIRTFFCAGQVDIVSTISGQISVFLTFRT
jgi:hypothetical protein